MIVINQKQSDILPHYCRHSKILSVT